jgi:protein TonB
MKYAMIAALAALPFLPTGSFAQDNITVQGRQTALSQWVGDVARRLEDNLSYPHMLLRAHAPSGIASVNFVCSDEGKPTAVTLSRRSGSVLLDRAAMRAVSRMKSLHPLPASIAPGQQFKANVIFAENEDMLTRYQETLRREMSRERTSGTAVAINIISHAPG